MGDNVYIFVDESGDPGDNDGTGENSTYYTELALQIDTEQVLYLVRHIVNWRYVKGMLGEPKQLPHESQELKMSHNFQKCHARRHQNAAKCATKILAALQTDRPVSELIASKCGVSDAFY